MECFLNNNKMANITSILEKLWKRIHNTAFILAKDDTPYHMIKDYNKVFTSLEKFKIEGHKTIGMIRENLFRSRPTNPNRQQLEDYMKRIESANEIMLSLDKLITKTFDSYIEFIDVLWESNKNLETNDQQKHLYEKYDMSLTEWQSMSNKIERFNEMIKYFI